MSSFIEKIDRVQRQLSANTAISTTVEGSASYQLAQSIAYESFTREKQVEDLELKKSIENAIGYDLDYIGENFFGIKRRKASKPFITQSMKAIRVFVSAGRTFGEINNGNDITLLAGTSISGTYNNTPINFVVEVPYTLPASDTTAYISGTLIQGPNGVIPANTLTSHNFNNYTDAANKSLLVNNDSYILTGRDEETDDNYRFRLSQAKRTDNSSNTDGVLQISRDVAGVSDVQVYQAKDGAGTCTIYVQGITPITGDETINDVTMALYQECIPPWATISVIKKDYIGLEMAFTINLTSSANITDQTSYASNLVDNIKSYINNFGYGKFYFEDLKRMVENLDQYISTVTINSAFIYRGTEPFRQRSEVDLTTVQYIETYETEKIVVELLENPITVTLPS